MSEKSDIGPMLSLQKSNDPTVKYVKYHGKINGKISNNMTNIFHRSTCPSTKAVNLFYLEKHSPGILFKLRSRWRKAKKLMKLM